MVINRALRHTAESTIKNSEVTILQRATADNLCHQFTVNLPITRMIYALKMTVAVRDDLSCQRAS
jgi:hypothetical protein